MRRRGEEGAVAAELAVTLSALILLLFGTIQFALVFWNWNTMLLAVEEAGRYTMLFNSTTFPAGPPGCADTLANCAAKWANDNNWGIDFDAPGVACTEDTAVTPWTMTCKVSYTFNFITSFTLSRGIQVPVI